MKNLIIVRHAKSSWDLPLQDVDRPLNERGVADAQLVAKNVVDLIPKSYIVWSSIAKRASSTAIIFSNTIGYPIENIVFKKELYTFDERQLEKVIKTCDDDYQNVIIFGHNEAITNFVNKFGDVYIDNVSTAGFVWLEFDTVSWQQITKARTKKIIFPKDLK